MKENETQWRDDDSYIVKNSFRAAKIAANGILLATQKVWEGEWDTGFALVRPPGHHAQAISNSFEGFCLLNNVAIAVKEILKKGARKIAILDWDVHHGNST